MFAPPAPQRPTGEETPLQKAQTIKEMLLYFKALHQESNRNLAESGESKHCSPFEYLEVQDVKEYALRFLVDDDLLDI